MTSDWFNNLPVAALIILLIGICRPKLIGISKGCCYIGNLRDINMAYQLLTASKPD